MNNTVEQLKLRFEEALSAAFGNEYAKVEPLLEKASNPKFGDYQSNVALSLAKRLGQQPRKVAEKIIQELNVTNICETPQVAGAGFINLTLLPSYLETQLKSIYTDSRLGIAEAKTPKRVIVDFSAPNIAKEMHVGHLRSTIIGDSIARVLEFFGHNVLRLNHVGDWGTQFGMLITHLRETKSVNDYDLLNLGELVEFYRESKKRFDDDDQFRERSRKAVVDLQSGDDEAKIAWKFLCNKSRIEFEIIYALLDVRFDEERGESFYNPFLSQVVEDLDKARLLVEDGGAKCVFLDGFTNKEGEPLPLIVQKSDGGYNYATTDLAAVRYRIEKDKANRLIYVTDAGQANHFAQVFQVARRASWIPENIEINHVPFGLVQGEDGKKLKTRSGETVKLKDLLDEAIIRARADLENRLKVEERQETEEFIANAATVVGISAVKYADLSQNRTSNYIFSYDRMLALQGNTAPYMLYAYARIQGISRKGEVNFEQLGDSFAILLQHETELTLAKHLLQLDDVIYAVEQDLFPNRLCEYLFQLSQKFNQFYDRDRGVPVLNAEEPLRTSRLVLCNLTARTLKLGLSLLGIQILDRM
ncbi:arginine--tRNA ligase [Chlorogloea sp. CCALA 695]|uniref:arginine--tRNA ligase n=1 Tax=Chlorogloea sp. CCALA 695 TaxID=2107693 RepID=UPI000D069F26|nr:arginine--tRNA ligase [Chlorogloea sp. CCALA 695]PSB27441.1 arginine--tRNA ligase [Chlorogloea sp. CCALA 695]